MSEFLDPSFQTTLKEQLADANIDITVTFTKVDGSTRIMHATLAPNLITESAADAAKAPRKPNPDVCVVWDKDVGQWRSFRWDSIREISFTG